MSIARSLNCDGRHGAGLALAVLLLLLPVLGGQGLNLAWRYERAAVAAGQWWRFVTCHLVHLDAAHALLNAVGLALLWAIRLPAPIRGGSGASRWASIAATGIGFWFFSTQLVWYVGASGVLHGVFACGCIAMLRRAIASGSSSR
jgi:rhomboid family GlyGly-CTERM serine protease